MLKSILKVEGVQGLSKNEQKEITGGSLGSSICSPEKVYRCYRNGEGQYICGCITDPDYPEQ